MKNDKETKHKRLKRVGTSEEDIDSGYNVNNNEMGVTGVQASFVAQNHIEQEVSVSKDPYAEVENEEGKREKIGTLHSLFNDVDDEGENAVEKEVEEYEEYEDAEDEYGFSDPNGILYDPYGRLQHIISSTFGDVASVLEIINNSPVKTKKKYDCENEEEEEDYEEDHLGKDFYLGEEPNGGFGIMKKKKKKAKLDLFHDIITNMERQKLVEQEGDDIYELDKLSKVSDEESILKKKDDTAEYNLFADEEDEEEGKKEIGKKKSGETEEEVEEEEEEDEYEEGIGMEKHMKEIEIDDGDDGGEDDEYYYDGDEIEQWDEHEETETDVEIEESSIGDDVFSELDVKELSEYEEIDEYALEEKNKMKNENKEGKTGNFSISENRNTNEHIKKINLFSVEIEDEKDEEEAEDDFIEKSDRGDPLFEERIEKSKKKSVLVQEKKKWKNFKAVDESKLRLKIERNSTMKYTDVSEKYYLTYKSRKIKQTKKILFVESKWIILKLKEKYPNYFTFNNFDKIIKETYDNTYSININDFLSEKFLIKKCMLTLNLLIKYKDEIPYILFHKSYLIFPPFNSYMLWDIYELDAIWYYNFIKVRKLKKKLRKCETTYKVHKNVHEILNHYNKIYYDDVYVYYYYIKNTLQGSDKQENVEESSNVLQLNNYNAKLDKNGDLKENESNSDTLKMLEDKQSEAVVGKIFEQNEQHEQHENENVNNFNEKDIGSNSTILCLMEENSEKKGTEEVKEENMFGENVKEDLVKEERANEDLFGENLLGENKTKEETEKRETEKEENEEEEKEKGNEKKKEETHKVEEQDKGKEKTSNAISKGTKRNNVKYMPTWVFFNYVKKNHLNILDEYILSVEDFYENLSYIFDSIKNEKAYHMEDVEREKRKTDRNKNTQDSIDFDLELKLYETDNNTLRTFKYNCSQIKNIVLTVPELYSTGETVQSQLEEWIKAYYPEQFSFCKDIFRTLISYYSKILACHPCIRYIIRFYFLQYACLTTVTTAAGEEKIDVGRADYFSCRLFRFPIYHLLGYNDQNEFINSVNNANIKKELNDTVFYDKQDTERVPSAYDMRHDPCFISNYNIAYFNPTLDESQIHMADKKKELERFYKLHKYKHIYLEVLKNRENKLVDLVIHPVLPGEKIPWKTEEFADRENTKTKRKKYEKDIKNCFEREKKRFFLSEKLDESWMNNIVKQLSFAYCYNDLEGNHAFVHLQKKILSNFLQVELLPVLKKNIEQMLYDSAQNWLMTYLYQSFYLMLNVQPLRFSYNQEEEEEYDDYEEQKYQVNLSGMPYGRNIELEKGGNRIRGREDDKKVVNAHDLHDADSISSITGSSRSNSLSKISSCSGDEGYVQEKRMGKTRVVDNEMDDMKDKKKKKKLKRDYDKEEQDGNVVEDIENTEKDRKEELKESNLKKIEQQLKQQHTEKKNKSNEVTNLFSSSETEEEQENENEKRDVEKRHVTSQQNGKIYTNTYRDDMLVDDSFSSISDRVHMLSIDREDKKRRAALQKIKRTHNAYDVVAIVCESVEGKVKSHVMSCDIFGDILDYVLLDYLFSELIEGHIVIEEGNKKIKDLETFAVFLKEVKPDIVVVGIRDIISYELYYHVKEFLKERSPQMRVLAESLYFPYIITCGIKINESLRCKYSRDALLCLSLCRFMQNRIYFIVTHFGKKRKDLVKMRLHDLQNYVVSYKIKDLYTRIVTDIVNKCGCDINFFNHRKRKMGNLLSFVSGLGYRKGKEIMKLLLKGGHMYRYNSGESALYTREDLMTLSNNKNLIGKTVYKNCCSFIRLIGPERDYFDALDNTRLHSSNCGDILTELLGGVLSSKKNQFLKKSSLYEIVNHIIDKKKAIRNMEIKELSKKVLTEKKIYIYPYLKFVQKELLFPYKDYRYAYEGLSEEDMFYAILNEQRENLKVGSEVVCRISSVINIKSDIQVDILPYGTHGEIHDTTDFLKQLKKYFEQKLSLLDSSLEQMMIMNRMELLTKTTLAGSSGGRTYAADVDDGYNIDEERRRKQEDCEREQKIEEMIKKQTGEEFLYESLKGELIKGRIMSVNFNLDKNFESRFQIVVTEENVKRLKQKYFENSLVYPFGYNNISPLAELDLTCDYNNFIENHFKKLNKGEDIEDFEPFIDGRYDGNENDRNGLSSNKLNRVRNQQYQIKKYAHHPNFKVWTSQEGHAYLKQKSVLIGECIICPSNDANTLSLLIKTCDTPFIVAKFTIWEKNDHFPEGYGAITKKHERDRTTRGGDMQQTYFIINNEKYRSLDEIVSRLCDRLKKNLLEIYKHPKCKKKKTLEQIKKEMYKESLSKPENIVWSIIPPILPNKNKKGIDKFLADFNPLRFTLLVIPPYAENNKDKNNNKHKGSVNNSLNVKSPKDLIILQDSIYVDHKSFKLWLRSERSLAKLIYWWKETGYWNRQNERQAYFDEKKKKIEEYRRANLSVGGNYKHVDTKRI